MNRVSKLIAAVGLVLNAVSVLAGPLTNAGAGLSILVGSFTNSAIMPGVLVYFQSTMETNRCGTEAERLKLEAWLSNGYMVMTNGISSGGCITNNYWIHDRHVCPKEAPFPRTNESLTCSEVVSNLQAVVVLQGRTNLFAAERTIIGTLERKYREVITTSTNVSSELTWQKK